MENNKPKNLHKIVGHAKDGLVATSREYGVIIDNTDEKSKTKYPFWWAEIEDDLIDEMDENRLTEAAWQPEDWYTCGFSMSLAEVENLIKNFDRHEIFHKKLHAVGHWDGSALKFKKVPSANVKTKHPGITYLGR